MTTKHLDQAMRGQLHTAGGAIRALASQGAAPGELVRALYCEALRSGAQAAMQAAAAHKLKPAKKTPATTQHKA